MRASSWWAHPFRFLLRREGGTSLALFRIGVGLTCLVTFTGIIATGQVESMWLEPEHGGYRELVQPYPWLFELIGLTPTTLWAVIAVLLLSAATLTIGLCGRLSALVLLQAHYAVTRINGHTTGCDDQLIHNALWLLILARSTATLSLGCWWRHRRWTSDELVAAWPRYLAIFQIVVVYFVTGISKQHESWALDDGSALYYILQDPYWQRWDMSWLAWVYPLVQASSVVTIIWERAAPLLLVAIACQGVRQPGRLVRFINKLNFRRWYVLIGVGVHLGIWILMGLGNFSWISLSFYFCLYQPEEWAWGPAVAPTAVEPAGRTGPRARLAWLVGAWLVPLYCLLHVAAVCYGSYPHEDREEIWEPLAAYYKYCGTRQGWPMFTWSSHHARRLYVDIQEEGQWRTVFAQSSSVYTWRYYQLNAEHLRAGVLYSLRSSSRHKQLADWFAARAAADFPGASRMRLRMHDFTMLTPEEVRAGRVEPYEVEETTIADVDLRELHGGGGEK
jgi:hypothetical protein